MFFSDSRDYYVSIISPLSTHVDYLAHVGSQKSETEFNAVCQREDVKKLFKQK